MPLATQVAVYGQEEREEEDEERARAGDRASKEKEASIIVLPELQTHNFFTIVSTCHHTATTA
jgi:hypothetical protein